MASPAGPSVIGFALLLGLSLFFGLAFEEFNIRSGLQRPGGMRTFPLLALTGGLLYLSTRSAFSARRRPPHPRRLAAIAYWHQLCDDSATEAAQRRAGRAGLQCRSPI